MVTKKNGMREPTLQEVIVTFIAETGPRKISGMPIILGSSYQSINSEALKLCQQGILEKDTDGVFSIAPGIDPVEFGIEAIYSDSDDLTPHQPEREGTLQDKFEDLLKSAGVDKGTPAITGIYFSGDDIWNAQWLHHVLSVYAQGFVTEAQSRLIMGNWTIKSGIPYRHEDFFVD